MTITRLKAATAARITEIVKFTRVETRVTGTRSADLIVDERLRISADAHDVIETMHVLRDLAPGQSVRVYAADGTERILERA